MSIKNVSLAAGLLVALLLAGCIGSEGQRRVQEANELLSADQLDEALAAYRDAQSMEPDLAVAHYGEGLALYEFKRYSEAEPALRRAVELDDHEALYYVYLGKTLSRLERLEEAEASFRRATELEPIAPEGWKGLGLTLYNQGRGAEARVALEKYLAFARSASDRSAIAQLVRVLPESPADDS
jgi:Flp pilus assembly protein TadD